MYFFSTMFQQNTIKSYASENFLLYHYILPPKNVDFRYSIFFWLIISYLSSSTITTTPNQSFWSNKSSVAYHFFTIYSSIYVTVFSSYVVYCNQSLHCLHSQLPCPSHFPSYSLEKPNPILNIIVYLLHISTQLLMHGYRTTCNHLDCSYFRDFKP